MTFPFDQGFFWLALVGAVFALGGLVKGLIGLGLPTIAMGGLSVAMPPAQAAALLIVPSLVTNLWQIGGAGLVALLRRLAGLLVGVCVGVAAGSGWLAGAGATAAWPTAGLGLALVAYAGLGLLNWRPKVPEQHERWLSPLIGLATGLVTAATGVFVIPAVPYLQALGLQRETLVRALGIAFLVSTIALGVALGQGGALPASAAAASVVALLPALAGMALGQALRRRIAPEPFRRLFLVGLLLLGLYLALRVALAA
jgi:uncharacterized protein